MYFVGIALLLSQIALCSSSLFSLTATPLIQTFTSHPGYDGHTRYPDGNYTQDWYITTNWINHTIKIKFDTCFIENSKGVCLFDYLYVYDGANSSSTEMMKTCCGDKHSATLESSTGEMYFLFETDNTVGDTGFEIEYWSNGITTTTTTTTVAPSTDTSTDSTYITTVQISSAGKTTSSASSSATSDKSDASVISTIQSSSHDPEANTVSTILDQNFQTTTGNFSQTLGISTSRASGTITGGAFSTETHNPNDYSSTASLDGSSTIINKETIDQNSNSSASAFTSTTITIAQHNSASSNTTTSPSTVSDDGKDTSTDSTYTTIAHVTSADATTNAASNNATSHTTGVSDQKSHSSASALTSTTITIAQHNSASLNTTTSPSTVSDDGKDNTRYIIIACVITGLLVIIVAVLIVVMVMKKNKAATYPRPFLVDDGKPIQPDSRNTKFKNGQKMMAFPVPPPTPPLHTVMPQAETNLFDLELPEKGRANRLPPLYSSIDTSNTN